ncbi:MAG: ABC transporter substrate-binding protein [Hyphomicrobiales bacterium]|nr:ABC transporter substrate-binding protein [Hyphomicrobiales bacterium]
MSTGRRRLLGGLLGVSVLAATAAAVPPAAAGEERARQFIEGMAERAVKALTVPDISRQEREKRFRSLLHEAFAVEIIGRWVLGRHWREATAEQRKEYLALFEDLIVATYVDRFKRYSGESLTVFKTVPHGSKDVLVFSRILRPTGGEPVDVTWRVRVFDGQFKIIDVMVEGVSMGQTQRSEFASVIRKNGDGVDGLLSELRKRLNQKTDA